MQMNDMKCFYVLEKRVFVESTDGRYSMLENESYSCV